MPKYFPLFVDLKDRPCLIVGAGQVATPKAAQLLKYGARLRIVAPEASEEVLGWARDGLVEFHQREFREEDLDGQQLVVGSTDLPEVNRQVYEAATRRGILVNIVDVPELCAFAYGALVERGDLQIAISTSGKSPAFAGYLRRQLEAQFGDEYADYLEILAECRTLGRQVLGDMEIQKAVYTQIMEMGLLELVRAGKIEEARKKALDCILQSQG